MTPDTENSLELRVFAMGRCLTQTLRPRQFLSCLQEPDIMVMIRGPGFQDPRVSILLPMVSQSRKWRKVLEIATRPEPETARKEK